VMAIDSVCLYRGRAFGKDWVMAIDSVCLCWGRAFGRVGLQAIASVSVSAVSRYELKTEWMFS
jgi:hypothetical protein